MTRLFGYTRALASNEDLTPEIEALGDAGAIRAFAEEHGARSQPVLEECLRLLLPGDVLIVTSSSRLTAGITSFVRTVAELGERGIRFRSLREPELSTDGEPVHPADVFRALDTVRGELLSLRTREGLADAATHGRRPGRPPVMTAERTEMALELQRQNRSIAQIARVIGVSPSAVRRALSESPALRSQNRSHKKPSKP